ncbi:RagB/SusD family nutrient uptake outer membrane protein [Chitinophaga sp.]|uniref:RagB/SusD family nutrient uptake outer membrane protein n=1 Tax=Chitinophaga sp. TaxID=1869181 RepID=UPI002F95D6E7
MKKYIIGIFAAAALLQACSSKLDVKPNNSLEIGDALADLPAIQSALAGTYDALQQTEYYGRNYWLMTELSGDNVYLSAKNSNRFISSFKREYNVQDADVADLWATAYKAILGANNIINSVDSISADQEPKNVAKGEALFIRALAYSDLVNMFAKPYRGSNGSQPGVPVNLKFAVVQTPRSSVADVYTRIITDLTDAKKLLVNVGADTKFHASQYAASALLARVYLAKGDDQAAIDEATNVINAGFSLTPAAGIPTFYNNGGSAEEIFTLRFTGNAEDLGSDNLGMMYLKPGYGDIRVSPDLYNTLAANDARKSLLGVFSDGSTGEKTNLKFQGQESIAGMHSPKLLRLAEMYLIRSEAYAHLNQAAKAISDLNTLRAQRGLAALSGVADKDVLDYVLAESRKEFMFEGHRYFDLLRNGKDVVRNFCHDLLEVAAPCTISTTSDIAICPIPQTELNTNPIGQNPGYGQ